MIEPLIKAGARLEAVDLRQLYFATDDMVDELIREDRMFWRENKAVYTPAFQHIISADMCTVER